MTKEEAIDLIDNLIGMVDDNHDSDYDTALKMAIKALEQMPCEDATNGEVLLQMFPPSVYYGDDEKHLAILAKDCELTCLNDEWWNAKYKTESEDKK